MAPTPCTCMWLTKAVAGSHNSILATSCHPMASSTVLDLSGQATTRVWPAMLSRQLPPIRASMGMCHTALPSKVQLTSADEGMYHPAPTSSSHPLILKLVYDGHQLQGPA